MRKLFLLLFTLVSVMSYGQSSTTDPGVIINGVKWATRNVDAPGTFAANPESFGMFYQWNRRTGWIATSVNVSNWDSSVPTGTNWTRANDPCPQGWRVPTRSELQSLVNAQRNLSTRNRVLGIFLGDANNRIFMPVVGARDFNNGRIIIDGGRGHFGIYWSSSQYEGRSDGRNAWAFSFSNANVTIDNFNKHWGFSVRCVADTTADGNRLREQAAEVAQQEEERRQREEEAQRQRIAQQMSGLFESQGVRGEAVGATESATTQPFNLEGRHLDSGGLVQPRFEVDDFGGTVVVDITVNPAGNVIRAEVSRGTTTPNAALRRAAVEAAKATRFNAITGTNNQQGTITYNFNLR